MKILNIAGPAIGALCLILGLYCQLEIVPQYDFFMETSDRSALENALFIELSDGKMVFGSIALFGGIMALLFALITMKKHRSISLITILLSFISIILGLMQATHMFS